MSSPVESWDLIAYRAALRARAARLRMDPRVVVKFDASDLVQETLLRAVKTDHVPPELDTDAKRLGWLAVIQDNALNDRYRADFGPKRNLAGEQAFAQSLADSSIEMPEAVDPAPPVAERVARNELQRQAAAELDKLGERERLVVKLKMEGLTFDEIAARLGLTVGETSAAYYRGLRQLRERMEGQTE